MSRLRDAARRRIAVSVWASCFLAACAAAGVGWTRTPAAAGPPGPSIRIVDVRPLRSPDPDLRDLITHTFAVRVEVAGWRLLPHLPGAGDRQNRPAAGHWRLYLDGRALGDTLGDDRVAYAYLSPGTHWMAAELSNADSTSLERPVWSEPVVLRVPRLIRCWQTGWRGPAATGTATFTCDRRRATPSPTPPLP